jgi:hypothetical protein
MTDTQSRLLPVTPVRSAEHCRKLAVRIRGLVWGTPDPLIQAQLRATARRYDKEADEIEHGFSPPDGGHQSNASLPNQGALR